MNRRPLVTLALSSSVLFLSTGCLCNPVEEVLDVVSAFRWRLVREDAGALSDGGPSGDAAVVWDGGIGPAPNDLRLPRDRALDPDLQNWK